MVTVPLPEAQGEWSQLYVEREDDAGGVQTSRDIQLTYARPVVTGVSCSQGCRSGVVGMQTVTVQVRGRRAVAAEVAGGVRCTESALCCVCDTKRCVRVSVGHCVIASGIACQEKACNNTLRAYPCRATGHQ